MTRITVIRDLENAENTFKTKEKFIRDIIKESKYYRHPDSATMSYVKIAEESIGKITSNKVINIGIVGAGPSGICALYELSKIVHNKGIKVTLYESDECNFLFKDNHHINNERRVGRISSVTTNNKAVYEIGAMRFPEMAGLTWYYAGEIFGVNKTVNPFPNPGTVSTEFVFGDRVDHYRGDDWNDPNSPTFKVKDLVANKIWKGDYTIGDKTPKEVSSLLKEKDTPTQTLKDIQNDWKKFVTTYDGTTLGFAVRKIISDSIDKLPDINGLSLSEKIDYYFELFSHFGFGTGPLKTMLNMSFVEMIRLILWNYSAEYLFPVDENIEFIKKLYNKAKISKRLKIKPKHAKVCDVFHRVLRKRAGVAYYNLDTNTSEPYFGNHLKVDYHDFVILAIPHVSAAQIISRFGCTTYPIQYGAVGIPSIRTKQVVGILPPLNLTNKHGEEAVNARIITAVNSMHMIRSAKVFATIKKSKANKAPHFRKKPIQAVVSDCGLGSSYIIPTKSEEYYSFLVSYTWEDDTTKQQCNYYDPRNFREKESVAVFNNVFNKMVDRSHRWIRGVNDNRYKLWWMRDFLKSVEEEDKFFFDWTAHGCAGGFKLDMAGDHHRSNLCFRYHTHATSKELNNRFFLASCSYTHLGGWLEGAFMSAINAVSGIVVAINKGNIDALNTEAKKLFQDLESVVPNKK